MREKGATKVKMKAIDPQNSFAQQNNSKSTYGLQEP